GADRPNYRAAQHPPDHYAHFILFRYPTHFDASPSQWSMNSWSTGTANNFAMRSASGRLGSYWSVSTALIVWRETPRRRASSPWLQPAPSRNVLTRFSMPQRYVKNV